MCIHALGRYKAESEMKDARIDDLKDAGKVWKETADRAIRTARRKD